MAQRYVAVLDPIRFCAAMAVVLYHYSFQDIGHMRADTLAQFGYLGVPLFFMISGFVISMSIRNTESPLTFLLHRAIRLYPAFILCSLVTVLFVALFERTEAYSAREIFLNATMFARQFDARLINGAYWSLAVEWIFYFLVAASGMFLGREKLHLFLWSWWALSVLNVFSHFGVVARLLILGAAPLFIAGAALYAIMAGQRKVQMWLLFAGSLPVALYWAISDERKLALPASHAEAIVVCIMLFFYLLMAAVACFPVSSTKPLKLMRAAGATSYPLYLVHETIGFHILFRWYRSGGPWSLVCLIAAMVVLSWLIAQYYEKPVQRWLKRPRKWPASATEASVAMREVKK